MTISEYVDYILDCKDVRDFSPKELFYAKTWLRHLLEGCRKGKREQMEYLPTMVVAIARSVIVQPNWQEHVVVEGLITFCMERYHPYMALQGITDDFDSQLEYLLGLVHIFMARMFDFAGDNNILNGKNFEE